MYVHVHGIKEEWVGWGRARSSRDRVQAVLKTGCVPIIGPGVHSVGDFESAAVNTHPDPTHSLSGTANRDDTGNRISILGRVNHNFVGRSAHFLAVGCRQRLYFDKENQESGKERNHHERNRRRCEAAIEPPKVSNGRIFYDFSMLTRLWKIACICIWWSPLAFAQDPGIASSPYLATGIKIGEVTDSTALVWTRLTLRSKRNSDSAPMVEFLYKDGSRGIKNQWKEVVEITYPPGLSVADIRDAVPGTTGQVLLRFRPKDQSRWLQTGWQDVDPNEDYTHVFPLHNLSAGTDYELRVMSRSATGGKPGQVLEGVFRTAPHKEQALPVTFMLSTGQGYRSRDCAEGYKIYSSILRWQPSFFVHTGDIVYYDQIGKDLSLARYHWQRTYSLPSNLNFHRQVSSYFIKDDHDTWQNDCWPGMQLDNMYRFTFEQGQQLFREQVPMSPQSYRTFRWGKDVQIWLMEGRDFRSPNTDPDGPEKTIWGQEQMEWLEKTVLASDASFRFLISPTPVIGPDRPAKNDNHANAGFQHEGDRVRDFLALQKNMIVLCGDRHWQYLSVDPRTQVREYSCGPVSDRHAGGWSPKNFVEGFHQFLSVKGGFLSVDVRRNEGIPTATIRFHDVDGDVRFEDVLRTADF